MRSLAVLALTACNPVYLTPENDDFAEELMGRSTVDCQVTTDVGYDAGHAFDIEVIHLDGRPVELQTANAYMAMEAAAEADGIGLGIVSGFRTYDEQAYLRYCYEACACNNCNLAARPGYSNHQDGLALDLNTSAPGVLSWLNAHGHEYGFYRTVPSEAWHWEHIGDGVSEDVCGEEEPAASDRDEVKLVRGPDGRLHAFALNVYGLLISKAQTEPNGPWGPWEYLQGGGKGMDVAFNAAGEPVVWLIEGELGMTYRIEHTSAGWQAPELMGAYITEVAAALNDDGRMEVFAVGMDGQLYHDWENAPGDDWHGLHPMPGDHPAVDVAVGTNQDGRLEVFTIAPDTSIHHRWQAWPGGWWSGVEPMIGAGKALAVGTNADGRLELFYIGGDDKTWHNYQTAPNAGWAGESRLSEALSYELAVGNGPQGELWLGTVGIWAVLLETHQAWGWTPESMVGTLGYDLAMANQADGTPVMVFLNGNRGIYIAKHNGSSWSTPDWL